jgi:hypothetical protein
LRRSFVVQIEAERGRRLVILGKVEKARRATPVQPLPLVKAQTLSDERKGGSE